MSGETPTDRGFWDAIYTAYHRPNAATFRWSEGIVYALIVLSIVLLLVELSFELGPNLRMAIASADQIILFVFAVDVMLRVASFRPPELDVYCGSHVATLRMHVVGRLRYCTTPLVLIDLVTLLSLSPALRSLRALRLLRLVSGARFFRYSNPFLGMLRTFAENRLLYGSTLSAVGVAAIIGGISLFLIEADVNEHIETVGDGIWWGFVTISTVGYGDINPQTAPGRVVGGVLMLAGMFTLALFAGLVSTTILNVMFRLREEQFRMSPHVNHLIICGYDEGSRMLLDAVLEELGDDAGEVIVFAAGERPSDLPPEFSWVPGDPTKESELDKVKLATAKTVVVVGGRRRSPQEADATTILTVFTVRAYLAKTKEAGKRREPVYVIAEILDAENVGHARTAGADEVIETTRLGFSLVAHSIRAPGSGQVMTSVASSQAASVFIGRNPFDAGLPYAEVAPQVRAKFGVAVIGLQDQDGNVVLTPEAGQVVRPSDRLVYLGQREVLPPV